MVDPNIARTCATAKPQTWRKRLFNAAVYKHRFATNTALPGSISSELAHRFDRKDAHFWVLTISHSL
jgi:hypothetical protein